MENPLTRLLDKIPYSLLIIMTLLMSLAPFHPEPHLLEKSRMLVNGSLSKPIDIFDLFWHSIWGILLILKLALGTRKK